MRLTATNLTLNDIAALLEDADLLVGDLKSVTYAGRGTREMYLAVYTCVAFCNEAGCDKEFPVYIMTKQNGEVFCAL